MTISLELNKKSGVIVGVSVIGLIALGMAVQTFVSPILTAQADQVGGSPDSGVASRLTQAYNSVVDQGHGASAVPEWTHDWSTQWNRIMRAASWTPGGSADPNQVLAGKTFTAGSRGLQTGTYDPIDTMYGGLSLQNTHNDTIGNATWTETSSGGTPASVILRTVTIALSSNSVMQDQRTGLYWTDRSDTAVSNNSFANTAGQTDRVNPDTNHCNFNSPGDANEWCNTADTGVSANELCLNLELDDGTGLKTDWRLPTQKELMIAFVNGAAANLASTGVHYWSSTQGSATVAWGVLLFNGTAGYGTKTEATVLARCVRG